VIKQEGAMFVPKPKGEEGKHGEEKKPASKYPPKQRSERGRCVRNQVFLK